MKQFLVLLLLGSLSWAKPLDINDALPNITLEDQFGNSHTIDRNISKIIITFDKKSSVLANKFISSKRDSSHYLSESNMAFVANISAMPALITKLFAMPKMKKYKHTILLINDDANDMFLSKKKHISIYNMENEKVKSITYIKGIEELNTSLQR